MNNFDGIKQKASKVFLKEGAEGIYTKLYDNLPIEQKKFLLSKVETDSSSFILGSIKSNNEWLLVTHNEVFWQSGNEVNSLNFKEIEVVNVNLPKLVYSGKGPRDLHDLEIKSSKGIYTISIETGPSLIGVMTVLNLLAKYHQRIA